jgi:hypothetical protein
MRSLSLWQMQWTILRQDYISILYSTQKITIYVMGERKEKYSTFLKTWFFLLSRPLCQKFEIAVIQYAPEEEARSLAIDKDLLPLTGFRMRKKHQPLD